MIFGYLILAHMLGDFVFQPRRLVDWKIRSKIGLAVHALVHFVITILILLPFSLYGNYSNSLLVLAAIIVSLLHFFIDATKIKYERNHNKKNLSFIIDQLCHVYIIILISYIFRDLTINLPPSFLHPLSKVFYGFYAEPKFIIFLALAIFMTIGLEVYHFQKLLTQDERLKFKPRYLNIIFRFSLLVGVWLYYYISTTPWF